MVVISPLGEPWREVGCETAARIKDSVTHSAGSQARSEGADCFQPVLQRVVNVTGLSSHGRDAVI